MGYLWISDTVVPLCFVFYYYRQTVVTFLIAFWEANVNVNNVKNKTCNAFHLKLPKFRYFIKH